MPHPSSLGDYFRTTVKLEPLACKVSCALVRGWMRIYYPLGPTDVQGGSCVRCVQYCCSGVVVAIVLEAVNVTLWLQMLEVIVVIVVLVVVKVTDSLLLSGWPLRMSYLQEMPLLYMFFF